jgi:membrane protein YdbS with pleckstrin-like domain
MNVSKIITMKDGERVLRVVRNHWFAYGFKALQALLLIGLAFFLMYPLFARGIWGIALFVALNAVGIWIALRVLVIWYWNGFIVTTMRIVDVDQRGFFSRTVSEAPFDKIQDVSYRITGLLGLFNVGTVELQTAGASATLDLLRVHDPKNVHHLITETMSVFNHSHGFGKADRVASLLSAASELSESEARAFLSSLRQAIRNGQANAKASEDERRDLEQDLKRLGPDA